MARIPEEELERLKREVSIEQLLQARGVELKAVGKDLRGRCPFHGPDEDPSLSVDPKRNQFHCFGCGAKGSVVDLVMLLEGVAFRHAVEILREIRDPGSEARGPSHPAEGPGDAKLPPRRSTALKLPSLIADDAPSDAELRRVVAGYYHETLKQSPEALGYLEGRGLDPEAMVDRFELGYSNRTLGYRLPQRDRKEGKAIRGRLAELGIIKQSGHELLRGSLVVPIRDDTGEVVQMYGRKIRSDLRKGTPQHLYLPGPLRGVFNRDALAGSKEIIVCEALIDALTFASAGYLNVTSAYGVKGFTSEHLEALKASGTERVLIAYDRDERGEQGAQQLARRLGEEGLTCYRVLLPHGMDVNEYAQQVRPATQSLGVLLRGAQYLSGPIASRPAATARSRPAPAEATPESAVTPSAGTSASAAPPSASHHNGSEPASLLAASAASPAPVASPAAPPQPASGVEAQVSEHEVVITLGERRWRARGLARNLSHEQLRINLLVSSGERFHVDSLELYSSRQRRSFIKQAAAELQVKSEVLAKDLGQVLMKLEQIQDQRIRAALEPEETTVKLSEEERQAAYGLLKDPRLLERVSDDLEACGLVGEHTNKLVAYLATISRKLDKPLGVMVQSSSAAGKSALMDAVLSFAPAEERVQYSAMTGQSLFYMGETDLKHKVLAIAEEEGAERASYALKLLQSEGKLSIASTGKDPKTGQQKTHDYYVEGPAAILLTTTAIDVDEELLNRLIVLTVDESREQTEAIHSMQRRDRTFEGLKRRLARSARRTLHQNAQRLLRPLYVVNPYSTRLTFLATTTRTRRDHLKYHGLIETIALLHQHQRPVRSGAVAGRRVDYVEVEVSDIAMANRLASDVLGRTLDELPPQTRRLLFLVETMVKAECEARGVQQKHYRFTRRQVREHTGWGNTQLKTHLHRLEEMEYLLIHRGGRGQSFVYELVYDGEGKAGEPFVLGLINVDRLKGVNGSEYDGRWSGSGESRSGPESGWSGHEANRSAPSRPQVGGVSGSGRGGPSGPNKRESSDSAGQGTGNAPPGHEKAAVVVVAASCSQRP